MLEHERTCTQRGHSEEGSYTKRLGLIISRSFFLGQLPSLVVPSPFFNLAFILPHSQYHPQSVSTLQHSARVSHLSLSQPLALSSSLSLSLSRLTRRRWGRKQSFGLQIKSSQRKAKDVISNISYSPFLPADDDGKICLVHAPAFPHIETEFLFTYAPLYMRVHIISAHETDGELLQEEGRREQPLQGKESNKTRGWWRRNKRSSIHHRCLNYLVPLAAGLGSIRNK